MECQCGCGGTTKDPHKNYMRGHTPHSIESRIKMSNSMYKGSKTIDSHGYLRVRYGGVGKTTKEQRLIAEKVLGKKLKDSYKVHHVNGNRSDNRNCNLVICEDNAYHFLLHKRERAYRACGNVNWRKCEICKQWDDPRNLVIKECDRHCYHRECYRSRDRLRKLEVAE